MNTYTAYFNYIYAVTLPADVVRFCSHSGDCDEDVKRCLQLPEVSAELSRISPEALITELTEYGAWTPEELANHQDNIERILWIAANNISEEQEVKI